MGVADVGLLAPVRAAGAAQRSTSDGAWLRAMLEAEVGLVRAAAATGQAPWHAARIVAECAAALGRDCDVHDLAVRARATGNPVVPLVRDLTAAVHMKDAPAAEYVHRGVTSQDVLDTATMLVVARTLPVVLADLDRCAQAAAALAARHRSTPMAGRTLTQHAVPTTFGLKAAGWRSLVLDARENLAALLDGGLPVQLGGAAGTLAAVDAFASTAPIGVTDGEPRPAGLATSPGTALVAAFARELGLAEPILPWHTLRTPVARLGTALGFAAAALGKIAADVLVLSRTEIAEVAEAAGGGSSAMPHKSNPVGSVLVAAAARQVPVLTSVLLGALSAEDERPPGAWHAEWQPLREALRLTAGAAATAADVVEGLRVDAARMRRNLGATTGLVGSEQVSVLLAGLLDRPAAARVVGAAVRRTASGHTDLAAALLADPEVRGCLDDGRLDGADLAAALDPTSYLGSAVDLVDRALARPAPAPVPAPQRHPEGTERPSAEQENVHV
ncbi:3-carboxy-cis,cis-muconate cycloisomerase [Frankia sp. QA3]|uniref:3-carboxy-cis,cis-muconate cycloisomerase n=1 Tax=Frankia sp. QA3 TaxID=710111 RepID=UPI000A02FC85|nr:3-carboxy-cis,cis-muconate cycloisomerase [Frankia sp. QA3]